MIDTTLRPLFLPPEWSQTVMERLAFQTDAIVSHDYTTQTRATRLTPRRSFEYTIAAEAQLRQRFMNMAYLRGANRWHVPVWMDGLGTTATSAAGATTVAAAGTSRNFVVGGPAFIQSPDLATFEVFEVAAVAAGSISAAAPLVSAYPAGSMVYPALVGAIDQQFNQAAFTSSFGYGRVKVNIAQANPFTAYTWPTTYRGYPVLEDRPETSRDPDTSWQWMTEGLDDTVGVPTLTDTAGIPLYRQPHDWSLQSRAAIDRFRSMVYALNGAQKSVWVPTWTDDLTLGATLAAGGTSLQVRRAGAAAVAGMVNRRDLRIETTLGTYYRRIASATDPGTGLNETLVLSSALPTAVNAANVIQISYMALCRSDTDSFELTYFTGEHADVPMAWRARQNDV